MKGLATVAMLVAFVPLAANAQGFALDVDARDVMQFAQVYTVDDLAVGERGLVDVYWFCAKDEMLYLPTWARLETGNDVNGTSAGFVRIERMPGGMTTAEVSFKEFRDQVFFGYEDALLAILAAGSCDARAANLPHNATPSYLVVTTVNGLASASDLFGQERAAQ